LRFFHTILLLSGILLLKQTSHAQDTSRIIAPFKDTTAKKTPDTLVGKLRYPIADRRADFLSQPSINPFDIRDSSVLNRRVDYDPTTKQYYITEKLGTGYNRFPSTLSFDEFWKLKTRKDEQAYFMQRANSLGVLNRKITRPKTKVFNSYFDRLFGKTGSDLKIDIKPVGEINIRAGYQGQNVKNPTLPERARRNGGFDFDANTNFSMNASIGDKLRFPINLNSLSNLGFDNQIKLNYTGKKDEVVKFIEAGNINYISRSTLIPSTQNLFGVKTQLQFGKLFVTGVMANQKSQRQSMALQGGSSTQRFQKRLDDYEENRHFLLSQYFRNNYNKVMSKLPVPNSQIQIKRIEVWVTNRNGQTTNARDVVGLADLGEPILRKEKQQYQTNPSNPFPDNNANSLYSKIKDNPNARIPSGVAGVLAGANLRSAEDYERTFARKLTENEYFFNQQVGFLSLNIPLQADEVLAVAFQYAYNGKIYQVGEFSEGVALDPKNGVQQILYLKLLKATSQRTDLPIWDLMMKNVYSLDLFGAIQQQDFQLNILYEEPSAGLKRYLPQVENTYYEGKSLLKILNLDTLNNRNDPQPDGVFDYVEGYTVLSSMGRIVFPLLEPFGKDLKERVFTKNGVVNEALANKYVFTHLYDSIKAIAQTYANLNRFVMEGQVKGSAGGSEISLNAFNVPPGSVSVRAGGQILKEGVDYMVDYGSGTVRIINPGILSSNIPVDVSYENNLGFGFQERGFRALRIDYLASKNFNFGLSSSRLNERPFFIKTNYGSDPIKNSMYGFDFNFKKDLPGLTRLLDKLPFYSTKAKSSIVAYGEAAYLQPGHAQQIGKGESGVVYLDDFEATRTNIDLRFPFNAWTLASTPIGDDNNPRFIEGELIDSIDYNKNRARLAWYTIEPNLQDRNSANNPLANNIAALSDSRVRQVFTNELFPQRTTNITDVQLPTFDLSYYPKERGPYNYNHKDLITDPSDPTKVVFNKPSEKWGGIMRALDQTDFETGIIEYVEFWVQNPFNDSTTARKGKLILNLGNVSEDILKDGRRFYENGMPTPTSPASIDSSTWGRVPVNPIQVTNAFSNNPEDRKFQDVGFDGLGDADELIKKSYLINQIGNSNVAQQFKKDPSADNYVWYRDASYDLSNANILNRYKYFNNPQGNSALAGNSQFSSAATLLPDNEDLNRDNTLNETEAYFEYEIDLRKDQLGLNTKFVTDSKTVNVTLANGKKSVENWYLFRVPIRSPDAKKIGGIRDFKSIRFLRMYLTGFEDDVTLRFAKLDLVRNQWRQYGYEINYSNDYKQISANTNTTLNTLAVSVEENGNRTPVNYVIPPGIERIQLLSNNGVNLLQNEQALALQVNALNKKEARGVFKTMNIDVRRYGKLSMFLHAESMINKNPIKDGNLTAVIRIGQDFQNNFYEVRIPLKVTPAVVSSPYTNEQSNIVWPNELNVNFSDLIQLKIDRDNDRKTDSASRYFNDQKYMVFGNPNLGEVRGILIAIENTNSSSPIDAEVWMNELRLSNLDERGAWAALGRMDLVLADLGTVAVSVNNRTSGFGSIEQKMNERAKTGFTQLDIAANIDAGKLLPKQAKISLPVFAGLNKTQENPEFDPFKKDVLYTDQIKNANASKRDSIKNTAIDQTTIKTLNFTNVRFMPGKNNTMLSPSNFDFSYSYSELQQTSPLIELNQVVKHRGSIGYTFNNTGKSYQPFSKLIKTKSSWFSLIKDFNFTPAPSLISYRTVFDRQFGEYTPRSINPFDGQKEVAETTFDKYFTMGRIFNLRWPLTRSINIDVISNLNSRIDEPDGRIDTKKEKSDLKEAILKGGRNTLYNQQITMRYDLPTSKFPLTDWILTSYNLSSNYNWIGASRLFTSLGNTIENTLSHQVNAQFNFNSFYNKSKFIRSALSDAKPTPSQSNPLTNQLVIKKQDALNGLTGKARDSAYKIWKEARKQERIAMRVLKANEILNIPGPIKTLVSILTMVQNASLDYTENYNSRLPGFTQQIQFIDKELKGISPVLEYAMIGKKLDSNWLNAQDRNGNLTTDPNFNLLFRQGFEQRWSARIMIEPIKTFIIDLKLEKTFTKEYSEFFKDTSTTAKGYRTHNNPLSAGGFSISYVALRTFFDKHDPNTISKQFQDFQKYRDTISFRVARLNQYWRELPANQQIDSGYAAGYGRYAQDVLIPSFIAAYTGKDPKRVNLLNQTNSSIRSNPFSGMLPMPNWNLLYNGLAAIPGISNVFSNISLTHGYNGTLSMNSFSSSLLYVDDRGYSAPVFRDPVSKNYVPYFLIPNVTISERMEPLIGLNVTTVSQWSIRFEYKKSRILALSLVDYQLSENNSTEWVIGTSFRKRGLKLPFNIPGLNNNKLSNDLTFRLDVAVRDVYNTNSRLDQSNAYGTGGQKEITLQPSVDYVLNSKINLKFFFDQRRATPYISSAPPITNTRAGVNIRIAL
jgi:cell surface protein SprA